VDFDLTRFYAISAMVELFEASELQALASFAATPEGRSALAKLPALGAILNPIIERRSRMPSAVSGSADRISKHAFDIPVSGTSTKQVTYAPLTTTRTRSRFCLPTTNCS
jgi:hypothetical protein